MRRLLEASSAAEELAAASLQLVSKLPIFPPPAGAGRPPRTRHQVICPAHSAQRQSDFKQTCPHTPHDSQTQTYLATYTTQAVRLKQTCPNTQHRRTVRLKQTCPHTQHRRTVRLQTDLPTFTHRRTVRLKQTCPHTSHRRTVRLKQTCPHSPHRRTVRLKHTCPHTPHRRTVRLKQTCPYSPHRRTVRLKQTCPHTPHRLTVRLKQTCPHTHTDGRSDLNRPAPYPHTYYTTKTHGQTLNTPQYTSNRPTEKHPATSKDPSLVHYHPAFSNQRELHSSCASHYTTRNGNERYRSKLNSCLTGFQ